jgi:hypothetical protein
MRALTSRLRTGLLAAAWLAAACTGAVHAQQAQSQPPASPIDQAKPAPPQPQPVALRQFQVTRATTPIKIDGVIDEDAWKTATVIDLPYEWFPGDNTTPPVKTEALITYDSENLYVAFRCQDPDPKQIRAHLMDRDQLTPFVQDDHVGFQIDTYNDERRAFQFRVNPFGVQADAVFAESNGVEDFSWDAIWNSAGRITADGWEVEIAVPFRQLRFPRTAAPQTWGIEMFRSYPRNVRHRISSRHTDRAKDCTLCEENKITGFQGIAPGRNLELDPTLTGLRTDSANTFPDDHLEKGRVKIDPGLTVRWGVTPNVSLEATVNPDFSQVEADVAQLAINTRFALYYPEKRPFFLEGADLFLTPLQAVFTRTVADPDWGVKINAKEGKDAYGLFLTEDSINNLIFPSNQGSGATSLNDNVTGGVFRYRRDVGDRSTLGVLYTDREGQGDDYHNRVGGLDGFFRFTPSDTIRVQYLSSDTQYPLAVAQSNNQPVGAFSDDAYHVQYDHLSTQWKDFISYEDLGTDFRADSGFMPRVDTKTTEGQAQRIFYGDRNSWFTQSSIGFHALRTDDHAGILTDQLLELFGTYSGPLQTAADAHLYHNRTFYNGTTFDLNQQLVDFSIFPAGGIQLSFSGQFGDDIDIDNTRPARSVTLLPSFQIGLGRHLSFTGSYEDEKLSVHGGQLFDAQLAQIRVVYQFNVRTFVRAIVQYQDISRNADLYTFPVDERSRTLFGQFLFSYKINPQTVLFTGYTDNRIGEFQIPLNQTDRTFFVKIGYALLY